MKNSEPMVKDIKGILKELDHLVPTFLPFYNDKRENGRRIKMPFLLETADAEYLQKELTSRFPDCHIAVKESAWDSHWVYAPKTVTTVHVSRKEL